MICGNPGKIRNNARDAPREIIVTVKVNNNFAENGY